MATGMTLVKKFTYRNDSSEEYSNQYWFTGTTPADTAAWDALFTALTTQEKTLYPSSVSIVRAYGYADDAAHATAVYVKDVSGSAIPGTNAATSSARQAGDAAVWVRWTTSRLSSPGGKRIYLRKYYHPALGSLSDPDGVAVVQYNALNAFGLKMRDGTFLDGRTLTAPGHTDVLTAHKVGDYMTTRTLKRRGKRPPT